MHYYCRLASTLATVSATSPCLDRALIPLWTSRRRPTLAFVAAGCSVSTTCRWRTQVRMVSRNANPSVTPISNYTGVIVMSYRATPSILSHPIFLSTDFPLHLSSSSDIIAGTGGRVLLPPQIRIRNFDAKTINKISRLPMS